MYLGFKYPTRFSPTGKSGIQNRINNTEQFSKCKKNLQIISAAKTLKNILTLYWSHYANNIIYDKKSALD